MPGLRRFQALLYAQQCTSESIVIYPLYTLMFAERSGLSISQISLLLGWWMFVTLVSELPTGMLADRFSAKSALFWSNILKAATFFIWLVSPTFAGYFIGFFIWGIGCALNSGAFQAYVYNQLAGTGNQKRFTKFYSQSQSLAFIGMVAAFFTATFFSTDYVLLLVASSAMSVVSALLVTAFPKPLPVTKNATYLALLRGGLKEVRRSVSVQRIVITLAVVAGLGMTLEEYVPLYYKAVGIATHYVPSLLAGGLLLSALLAWLAHRFERRGALFQLLLVGVAASTLLLTSFYGTLIATGGILLCMRLVKLSTLLYESSLQHNISGHYRATIGSIPAFAAEAIAVGLIFIYGIAAHIAGTIAALRLLACLAIVTVIMLVVYWRNHRLINRYQKATVTVPIDDTVKTAP